MDKETVLEEKQTDVEQTSGDGEVRISPRTGKPVQTKYAPKTKPKGKPRGGNNWLKAENVLTTEDGENTKFLTVQMELLNMADIDLYNVEEVQERLNEYFGLYAKHDMKPTVAGMAIALGMNRRTLWGIVNDAPTGGTGYKTALPPTVTLSIKRAYFLLENLWETYMQSGKINPMAGVFFGINNYGYRDVKQVDVVPVITNNPDNDYNTDEIRERYIATTTPQLEQGSDDSED